MIRSTVNVSLAFACSLLVAASSAHAQEPRDERQSPRDEQVIKNVREDRSIGEVLLFYIPNRVFDVLDLVRARVRVGPGVAVRARATEGLDVGIGSYASIFAGLPGPRVEVELPLPVGFETYSGVELMGDAELSGGFSPEYSETEIGVSAQIVLVGFDIGVDPFEVIDLAVGFLLIDFREDDF